MNGKPWMDDAFMVAGGWEPLMYLRRSNQGSDIDERFVRQHADESFRRMKDDGIRLFITHYHKGFGWEIIREERKDIKRQVSTLHRLGMKAGVYFRIDNVFSETFFLEMPEAREWLVRSQDGTVPRYAGLHYRCRVCRNVPGYRAYVRKVLRYAVREIKADLVHCDGFHGLTEKEECRCPHCQKRFGEFLKGRWGNRPREAQRRFGFSNLAGIEIPPTGPGNMSEAGASLITDPVYQEYIRFRCENWAEWYRFVTAILKEAQPDAAFSLNSGVFSWQNTAASMGMYLPALPARNTFIFIEDGHFAWVHKSGVIAHRVRDYLLADTLGFRCIAYCHEYNLPYLKRSMSESMAFNGGMMGHVNTDDDINGPGTIAPEMRAVRRKMADWRSANAGLWKETAPAAEVGVLRSYSSMTFDCYAPWRHTMLLEETLLRRQVPFVPIFDEQIGTLKDRGIKLLVLGNQSCLGDREVKAVTQFVAGGGNLLVTGGTGIRTEDAILRKENVLVKALELSVVGDGKKRPAAQGAAKKTVRANFETTFGDHLRDDAVAAWPSSAVLFKKVLGRGTVIYLPDVISSVANEIWFPAWQVNPATGYYDIPGDVPESSPRGPKEYPYINWRLPVNAGQIIDAVRALGDAPFTVDAPDTLLINWRRQVHPCRDVVHFVNYFNEHPVFNASLLLRDGRYRSAEFFRMDPAFDPRPVVLTPHNGVLRLPEFLTYGILTLGENERR